LITSPKKDAFHKIRSPRCVGFRGSEHEKQKQATVKPRTLDENGLKDIEALEKQRHG